MSEVSRVGGTETGVHETSNVDNRGREGGRREGGREGGREGRREGERERERSFIE